MAEIRINLGSGDRYRDGWCNVDLYAKRADVRQDLRVAMFPENYAVEISCIHTIEHLEREAGALLLERCYSWLKVGGTLEIETPDRWNCERLVSSGDPKCRLMGAKGLLGGRSGSPEFKATWHNWLICWAASGQRFEDAEIPKEFQQRGHAHLYVWESMELDRVMNGVGFTTHHGPPQHHGGRGNRDLRIVGVK